MIRAVVTLLLMSSAADQPAVCDEQVTRAWNVFAVHAKDYLDKRQSGVRDVKMRARMVKDFETLMGLDCF